MIQDFSNDNNFSESFASPLKIQSSISVVKRLETNIDIFSRMILTHWCVLKT